jgi:DNA modification methylase
MKDVNVILKLVKILTNEGDLVLDCFMGSGTTGVACKILQRRFIGIELDKHYFEVASDRLSKSVQMELFN